MALKQQLDHYGSFTIHYPNEIIESPVISVIMAVYNCDIFLDDAIQSIINQTFSEFELIVINDGSTDQSFDLLLQWQTIDNRMIIINQENMGLTKSLNRGLSLARGEFIARHDCDDYSHKERFNKQLAIFDHHPNVIIVGSDVAWIDETNTILDIMAGPQSYSDALSCFFDIANPYVHGSIMVRKHVLQILNGYRDAFQTSQDFDLYIRMTQVQGEWRSVPEVCYYLRIHSNSITAKKWMLQLRHGLACARQIQTLFPNKMRHSTIWKYIVKKLCVGLFSFISPVAFYYFRKAYITFDQDENHDQAIMFFRLGNSFSRVHFPEMSLPVMAKMLRFLRRK